MKEPKIVLILNPLFYFIIFFLFFSLYTRVILSAFCDCDCVDALLVVVRCAAFQQLILATNSELAKSLTPNSASNARLYA